MSLSIFSKLMTIAREHPLGAGNLATGTSVTSLTLSGYISANYQAIHLTLTALITAVGVASYLVKIKRDVTAMREEKKRTKIIENKKG